MLCNNQHIQQNPMVNQGQNQIDSPANLLQQQQHSFEVSLKLFIRTKFPYICRLMFVLQTIFYKPQTHTNTHSNTGKKQTCV